MRSRPNLLRSGSAQGDNRDELGDVEEAVMGGGGQKRARRSTRDTLDNALSMLSQVSTLKALLATHERSCTHGEDCEVARAIRRRLAQLKTVKPSSR